MWRPSRRLVEVDGRQRLDADRVGSAVFSFGGDDSISVTGVASYQPDQSVLSAGIRRDGAVIGGTGRFLGASGQVESVRGGGSSYTHTFTLL